MAATGDFALAMPQDGVSIAFAPHDRTIWSVDGGSSQATPVIPGSVLIHPNRNFVWHYREKESLWLYIKLKPQVLNRVAQESGLSNNLKLEYRVLFCDPTILHLAQLLKAEVVKSSVAEEIYIESIRNLLAVHLIRNYSNIRRSQTKQLAKTASLSILQVKQL